jgi:hypothetical protein
MNEITEYWIVPKKQYEATVNKFMLSDVYKLDITDNKEDAELLLKEHRDNNINAILLEVKISVKD